MKTATLKRKPTQEQSAIPDGQAASLPIEQFVCSPLNYRKYYKAGELETFAQDLALHSIISPLTVRKTVDGNYEIVAGERRWRAAKIAKLSIIPVVIRELTDDQVIEIQLAENLQRENPHPLDEAHAVKVMQDAGKSIDDISLRLGKSKQFVYVRLKLLNLIEPIREMFFADGVTIQQAVEIATVSQDAQQQFFADHCDKWKEKNFKLNDVSWCLRRYKYDLHDAPFDIKNKKLLPSVGACTGCSFNSATIKSLFPEYAKQAICSNPTCYKDKCIAHLGLRFVHALQEHAPVALIHYNQPSEDMQALIQQVPEAAALTQHEYHQITIVHEPEEPDMEEFRYDDGDEKSFDAAGYEAALQEFYEEVAAYQEHHAGDIYQTALMERKGEFFPVLFSPEPPAKTTVYAEKGVTMKMLQESLNTGTATPELVEEAIQGLKQREKRAQVLDQEKVQLDIHAQLAEHIHEVSNNKKVTSADTVAVRLLLYHSLDYTTKQKVHTALFEGLDTHAENTNELFYQTLQSLTAPQFSYLVRMALACRSDSKYPRNDTGFVLRKVAMEAGVDVVKIEKEQEEKAQARNERAKARIGELEKKATKLRSRPL